MVEEHPHQTARNKNRGGLSELSESEDSENPSPNAALRPREAHYRATMVAASSLGSRRSLCQRKACPWDPCPGVVLQHSGDIQSGLMANGLQYSLDLCSMETPEKSNCKRCP